MSSVHFAFFESMIIISGIAIDRLLLFIGSPFKNPFLSPFSDLDASDKYMLTQEYQMSSGRLENSWDLWSRFRGLRSVDWYFSSGLLSKIRFNQNSGGIESPHVTQWYRTNGVLQADSSIFLYESSYAEYPIRWTGAECCGGKGFNPLHSGSKHARPCGRGNSTLFNNVARDVPWAT
jgi:hypothetical protein